MRAKSCDLSEKGSVKHFHSSIASVPGRLELVELAHLSDSSSCVQIYLRSHECFGLHSAATGATRKMCSHEIRVVEAEDLETLETMGTDALERAPDKALLRVQLVSTNVRAHCSIHHSQSTSSHRLNEHYFCTGLSVGSAPWSLSLTLRLS